MTGLNTYILGIGAAALVCGILACLNDEKSSAGILTRMVCGLFLTIVVIKPISNLNYSYLDVFSETFDDGALEAASAGTELALDARREIIKAETEAYILDKASLYGAQLEVQVTLSDGEISIPESVCLNGAVSPYAKSNLKNLISNELGIPEERQLWIG